MAGMNQNNHENPANVFVFGQPDSTERIIGMLDEVERRVEALRIQAQGMEKERNGLIEALSYIKHTGSYLVDASPVDKEDIKVNVDRLERRCTSVEINVTTPRNATQMRALTDANKILDEVACQLKQSVAHGRNLILPYLNACQPDVQPSSPVDQRFQSLLIECTGDDQKKIRDGLCVWKSKLERAEVNL
ncbi:BAG family molecular chaperone regulator 2-like [Lineus longissimus]|uniref:BAG family molecular chaperone regulator 2-like n=1 Tax=Lineus longissimus TaxID=88925 RepID=UPI00315D5BD4